MAFNLYPSPPAPLELSAFGSVGYDSGEMEFPPADTPSYDDFIYISSIPLKHRAEATVT